MRSWSATPLRNPRQTTPALASNILEIISGPTMATTLWSKTKQRLQASYDDYLQALAVLYGLGAIDYDPETDQIWPVES